MKILILANHDMGLYKFRRELIEMLLIAHEVYVCVPSGEFVEKIKEMGCHFISCDVLERRSTNPFKDLNLILFYKKVLKKIRPDIVLSYTIKPNVYGGIVCGREKIPYISNVTGLGTTIENGGLLAFISTSLYKIGLKNAACVFFQNKENQRLFVDKNIVKGNTKLIPGSGVNLDIHCFEEYPEEGEYIRFLFVGRIMKDKGIEELLKAIRILHKEDERILLDIVGFCDEDYLSELKEAELDQCVMYHGVQYDVHPFYAKCHCAVLPSYHEGMANVMLEASATGRPVITTRVSGCQETFDENVTGFGCDAKDVESLTQAMRRFSQLSHGEKERMGENARKKMEREFDRKIVLEAYDSAIHTISTGPPKE